MKDFQTMFPDMDPDVIEAVLRANNGMCVFISKLYLQLKYAELKDEQFSYILRFRFVKIENDTDLTG